MKETTIFPFNLVMDVLHEENGNFPADIDGTVDYVISRFDDRVQRIIVGRYKEGKSHEQLGNEFGVTRERIRQIETMALRRMRHPKCRDLLSMGIAEYIAQIRISAAESSANKQISAATEVIKIVADRLSKITGDDEFTVMFTKQEIESRKNLELYDIGLSMRSRNVLYRAGIKTVGDILDYGDLRTIKNMGERSIEDITRKIRELGFEITVENEP